MQLSVVFSKSKGVVEAAKSVWQRGMDCLGGAEEDGAKFGVLETPLRCVVVADLIPENSCTRSARTAIAEATEKLWANVESNKNKNKNWKKFCVSAVQIADDVTVNPLSLCTGFSSICRNMKTQELMLKLVCAALSMPARGAVENGDVTAAGEDETENEADGSQQSQGAEGALTTFPPSPKKRRTKSNASASERSALFESLGSSVEDLKTFVKFVVCAGGSLEIRNLAKEIAAAVFRLLPRGDKLSFLTWCIVDFNNLKNSQCVDLITSCVEAADLDAKTEGLLAPFGKQISDLCVDLLTACEEDPLTKFVDMVSLVKTGTSTLPPTALPAQEDSSRPVSALKLKSTATGFSETVTLKTRMHVNKVSLAVSEPRGKYVKTIKVSFSPDPDSDVYEEIGVISLSKGGHSGSCEIPGGVTAATLKFHYDEFYPKPGGGEEGAMCPRCSR